MRIKGIILHLHKPMHISIVLIKILLVFDFGFRSLKWIFQNIGDIVLFFDKRFLLQFDGRKSLF